MGARPEGIVTFVFTDVELSTRLLTAVGPARYRAAIEDHRSLVRTAFTAHGGYEVDSAGDGLFVAFGSPCAAVAAAVDAQRALIQHTWAGDCRIKVRMGAHTGEAELAGHSYVGLGVHRAARIAAAAHGEQILLSDATATLVAEGCAALSLRNLGIYRLKDFPEQRIFQVLDESLPAQFPPPRTAVVHTPSSVSAPTLLGRDREVEEVTNLLTNGTRLVTLIGPGGVGKTSIAKSVVARGTERFSDGGHFVSLGALADTSLLIPTFAQALGIDEAGGQSLASYLIDKRMLIVLDNLEQLPDAASAVLAMLDAAPEAAFLATSRVPLQITPERTYRVDALDTDTAVSLFRLRATDSGQRLDGDATGSIAAICRRVDCLPLAVELAAARTRLLSPDEILNRLEQHFDLLSGAERDRPERHQSVRSTVAWSYDLLQSGEQHAFVRSSVFRGSFRVDAAESVCGASVDELAALVDHNLIRSESGRLSMLHTVRSYAQALLVSSSGADALADQHADYYLELAEHGYRERTTHEKTWLDRLHDEHDNLRAALDWLRDQDDERFGRLVGALGWFWLGRSHLIEGRERLSEARARPNTPETSARIASGLGAIAGWQGDIDAAEPSLLEAIAAWHDLSDDVEEALTLEALAWAYFWAGRDEAALEAAERSVHILEQGGSPRLVNHARLTLCQVLVAEHHVDRARDLAGTALDIARAENDIWSAHLGYHYLADCAVIEGDYEAAARHYTAALEAAVDIGNRAETALELQGMAMALAGLGYGARALEIDAVADAELATLGVDISSVQFWAELRARAEEMARANLPQTAADSPFRVRVPAAFDAIVAELLAAAPR